MSDEIQDMTIFPDQEPYSEAAVHTWFGVAASCAQTYEQALGIFLIVQYVQDNPIDSKNSLDSIDKKTQGQILKGIHDLLIIDPLLDEELQKLVKVRNYLFHDFFTENWERIKTESGRNDMVNELQGFVKRFNNMSEAIFKLVEPTIDVLGISMPKIISKLKEVKNKDIS